MKRENHTRRTIGVCSCGMIGIHLVAERHTDDGCVVLGYSNGTLALPHGPSLRKPAPMRWHLTTEAMWLVLEEVSLYEGREVPALVEAARTAAVQHDVPALQALRTLAAAAIERSEREAEAAHPRPRRSRPSAQA